MKLTSITHADAKGAREYMEDKHFILELFPEGNLLAVFDGHGGPEAAARAHLIFSVEFTDALRFFNGDTYRALSDSIKCAAIELSEYEAGTTLSAVFIPAEGDVVHTAVLGDSPILISGIGGIWVGPDHNVRTNPAEREAAEARGGYCDGNYVFRNMHSMGLQMARALGDSHLKGILSTEPEMSTVPLHNAGFILVATDGLFDPTHRGFEVSKKQVLELIRRGHEADALVADALLRQTNDNVTAILARF